MKGYWKVPFRQVYCDSFVNMLKQTLWCHLVIKVFPCVVDVAYGPLDPQDFVKQYAFMFKRAKIWKIANDESEPAARRVRALMALRDPLEQANFEV